MPIILWGQRSVHSKITSGSFYCPQCNSPRDYKHKRVRRFFHLYYIPLIPLGEAGEYIECQTCRGTFNTRVLTFNPGAEQRRFEAEFHRAVKRVLVAMLLADGVVDDKEIDMVQTLYNKITNSGVSVADIRSEVARARTDSQGVEQFLSGMAGQLNANGKELVLKAAFFVAAADGQIQKQELTMLESIGRSLDMTPSHFNGVLQSLASSK